VLVLKRHTDESIIIGSSIRVVVVETGPGFARIGIDAPREISVHREEVHARLRDRSPDGVVRPGVRREGVAHPGPAPRLDVQVRRAGMGDGHAGPPVASGWPAVRVGEARPGGPMGRGQGVRRVSGERGASADVVPPFGVGEAVCDGEDGR
jgi:carbon storage regulator